MRLRAPRVAIVAMPLVVAVSACGGLPSPAGPAEQVQGQGSPTTEDRTQGDFTHVSVSGGIRVEISEGAPTSVILGAQPNLLPLVETEVTGGQLVVNVASPGFTTSEPVTLEIVAPSIESVTLSGGASGALETTADTLVLDVSGGAMLDAAGSADTLTLTVSSGAQAALADLAVRTATVKASDGSQATINVSDSLTGDVTAGATVRLTQKPASVDVTTSVGGMVIGG